MNSRKSLYIANAFPLRDRSLIYQCSRTYSNKADRAVDLPCTPALALCVHSRAADGRPARESPSVQPTIGVRGRMSLTAQGIVASAIEHQRARGLHGRSGQPHDAANHDLVIPSIVSRVSLAFKAC